MSADLKDVFVDEGEELLQSAEDNLLLLEGNPGDGEALNALFRVMHTFKGSAGVVGFEYIQGFTHRFENFLDMARNGETGLNEDAISLLLKSKDFLSRVINLIKDTGSDNEGSLRQDGDSILLELENIPGTKKRAAVPDERSLPEFAERDKIPDGDAGKKIESRRWHISLKFHENFFLTGMDPYSFISYLSKLGNVESIASKISYEGEFEYFNPESCYLGIEINFVTPAGQKEIADVFEFARDDCDITLNQPDSVKSLPISPPAHPDVPLHAGARAAGRSDEYRSLRVDAKKLDNVINIVGELVTTTSGIMQRSKNIGDSKLEEFSSNLFRLVSDLRDYSMDLRMVPIDESLGKFKRLIRDLAKESGKDVNFEITGGETELDKTFIEKINDPLIHIIRNSLDHGIESNEERGAAGKNPAGSLRVNAYNDSGNIMIEISDDGRGLDRDKIGQKAVKMGLIQDYRHLSATEIYAFIFHPGLSTAEKVTNISGRGVGMDVVKRNIEELHGSVTVESEKGKFTRVKIRLPLTLAIIDGFLVEVAGEKYVIPLSMVVECIDMEKSRLEKSDGRYISLRGKLLPYIDLHGLFGVRNGKSDMNSIVVIDHSKFRVGFVVDEIYGEIQAVIKSLGEMYGNVGFFSGASILGDGEVALILDIAKLIRLYPT